MLVMTKRGQSPVLLEMPHSGIMGLRDRLTLPKFFDALMRYDSPEVLKTIGFGCDAAAPLLSGYDGLLATLPLSGVHTGLARAFVDCNRSKTEVSGLALAGADMHRYHHGIIWARTMLTGIERDVLHDERRLAEEVNTKGEPMLRRPLTAKEFAALMRFGYDPYHAEVAAHHRRIVAQHDRCIHIALHTLPAFDVRVSQGGYVCGAPAQRGPLAPESGTLPDIILIHNGYAAADRRYVDAIRRAFTDAGLIVSDGTGPFLGSNGVTNMYGDPKNGVHVIGIEHVTHDGIEPHRHDGRTIVSHRKAKALQSTYRQAVRNVLNER